jgi:hypothetical protein
VANKQIPQDPTCCGTDDPNLVSTIEEQVGAPLRELRREVETFARQIQTAEQQRERAEEPYRRGQRHWQMAYVLITGVLSTGTLIVLAWTLRTANRQVGIAATQTQIMRAQATIMDKQRSVTDGLLTENKRP